MVRRANSWCCEGMLTFVVPQTSTGSPPYLQAYPSAQETAVCSSTHPTTSSTRTASTLLLRSLAMLYCVVPWVAHCLLPVQRCKFTFHNNTNHVKLTYTKVSNSRPPLVCNNALAHRICSDPHSGRLLSLRPQDPREVDIDQADARGQGEAGW
jgi:hypothetical protein